MKVNIPPRGHMHNGSVFDTSLEPTKNDGKFRIYRLYTGRYLSCRGKNPKGEQNDYAAEKRSDMDNSVDEAGKDNTGKSKIASEDRDIAVTKKKLKLEKEPLKRKMDGESLFENERLEMKWALKKRILAMEISSKMAFQKNKERKQKELQERLKRATVNEKETEKTELPSLPCGFSNQKNLARLQESLRRLARVAVYSMMFLPEAVP